MRPDRDFVMLSVSVRDPFRGLPVNSHADVYEIIPFWSEADMAPAFARLAAEPPVVYPAYDVPRDLRLALYEFRRPDREFVPGRTCDPRYLVGHTLYCCALAPSPEECWHPTVTRTHMLTRKRLKAADVIGLGLSTFLRADLTGPWLRLADAVDMGESFPTLFDLHDAAAV